ncbi:DUF1127 domain-containing protein [Paracoccus spongiarum]|uniref:DUF1127 domain-containing protein n=1 Tax=Paracoccus spongiarum TaxID=3064387 RepID=A0ABT9JA43_9RHOB|nr:DUF1127 domain-containing protein [Paracoccus sp. 2205BS29-5]MDP5306495.1 DUF1127 domain-containing protein [Paracoccus sp. 2205BS29-5]
MATTANIGRSAEAPRLSAILAAPFLAIGRFLVMLAEASPRMQALERLNRIPDAELKARGLTRDGEMRRILGISGSI